MGARNLMKKRERPRKEQQDAQSTSWSPSEICVDFWSRMGSSVYPTAGMMFGASQQCLAELGLMGAMGTGTTGVLPTPGWGERSSEGGCWAPTCRHTKARGIWKQGSLLHSIQLQLCTALGVAVGHTNSSVQPLVLRKPHCVIFKDAWHHDIRKSKMI